MFKLFLKKQPISFYVLPILYAWLAIDSVVHQRIVEMILWICFAGVHFLFAFQSFILEQYRDVVSNVITLIPEIEDLHIRRNILEAVSDGFHGVVHDREEDEETV